MIHLAAGPTYPTARNAVYLPIAASAPVDPVSAFYDLLLHDSRQQRPRLEVCPALAAAAAWKAADIAANGYWSHRAANGEYSNETARRFGCKLTPDYDGNWNGCESLVAGSAEPLTMYNALVNSPTHRQHLFGENDFFRGQTHCGIAMVVGGRYGWVWAVYIARCA